MPRDSLGLQNVSVGTQMIGSADCMGNNQESEIPEIGFSEGRCGNDYR